MAGRTSSPRNYLSRKEYSRLFLIVGSVGLMIILTKNAQQIFQFAELQSSAPQAETPDTRLRRTPSAEQGTEVSLTNSTPLASASPLTSEAATKNSASLKTDRALLNLIEDDTAHRSREHEAWLHILDILLKNSQSDIEQQTSVTVYFSQLFNQPDAYRGSIVTIQGIAKKVLLAPMPENRLGIHELYQVWVQPDGANAPLVIFSLNLPDGFPVAPEIDEPIQVTGIFYKRWAYTAHDGLRTAPMMISKTLSWQTKTSVPAPPSFMVPLSITGIGVVLLFLLLWRQNRISPNIKQQGSGPPDFQTIVNSQVAPSIEDSLKDLSRSP